MSDQPTGPPTVVAGEESGSPPTLAGGLDPELTQALHELLNWIDLGRDELGAELSRLENQYQDAVYSELLYLMSHLSFDPEQARLHWERIQDHREALEQRLGHPVDLRVAMVSYFVQVDRQFRNPKIIEMRLFEQTRDSAYADELTGLRNYRFLLEFLGQEILRSDQFNAPLSLIMIDVDDFKRYNDQMGHQLGNDALVSVARLLGTALRKVDVATRYGGEEFAVVLPGTEKPDARTVAERIRQSVDEQSFPGENEDGLDSLTVSLGIATYPADAKDATELIRHADRAMYLAKSCGKNRVQLYGLSSRSHRRTETVLEGHFRGLASEPHPLTTVKVSPGGMQFRSTLEVPVGSLIDVMLKIPGEEHEIGITGRSVTCEPAAGGGFDVGMRALEICRQDRRRLCNYLRSLDP